MMLLFLLLISVIVTGAVRFNESDLVIKLEALELCDPGIWTSNNYTVDSEAHPMHFRSYRTVHGVRFMQAEGWGITGHYNITNDQLQNLKWTYQMVQKSGRFKIVADTGETEKKELDEICNTALWNEMVRAGTVNFTCPLLPGHHWLFGNPINFTRIFPEDQVLYHGEIQHHYVRFYDTDSLATCFVMTIGVRSPEELEKKNREIDEAIRKG